MQCCSLGLLDRLMRAVVLASSLPDNPTIFHSSHRIGQCWGSILQPEHCRHSSGYRDDCSCGLGFPASCGMEERCGPSHLSITGSRREGWPMRGVWFTAVAGASRGGAQHYQIPQEGASAVVELKYITIVRRARVGGYGRCVL